ncbi:hypothetical protein GCM10022233_18850 [Streptomyces shaanxiensis]|uniref:Uncharacterized protein n=1 Tax=Streptomyces shaanxiensis TaxID=653357 RepID=A0ABP7UP23_9ACTN
MVARERHRRPTLADGLTCIFGTAPRSAIFQGLIRDEEVVGSNPATPTVEYQVRGPIRPTDQAPDSCA